MLRLCAWPDGDKREGEKTTLWYAAEFQPPVQEENGAGGL